MIHENVSFFNSSLSKIFLAKSLGGGGIMVIDKIIFGEGNGREVYEE